MINIYDKQKNVILSVMITQECVKTEALMASDFIQLSWNSADNTKLPAGAYIEYQGEKYYLLQPYRPTQKDEVEYTYTPQFHSRVMLWQKLPFFLYTKKDDGSILQEPDWELTSNASSFMDCVKNAIKNVTGEDWEINVAGGLPASAYLHFSNSDIFSALNSIANVFETEWYADKATNTIHLGKIEFGEQAKDLIVEENIGVPSVSEASEGFYNRFYVFGSTRNITQDNVASSLTNTVANKRLTLDEYSYPYSRIDIGDNGEELTKDNTELTTGNTFVKTLYFDDVYPRATDGEGSKGLKISDVKYRTKYRYVEGTSEKVILGYEDGEPIYETYPVWYFRLDGFDFDKEMIIEGTKLKCSFESGALQGYEFELIYHDEYREPSSEDATPIEINVGDYEILFIEENNLIIPAIQHLVPRNGDEVALFNIKLPDSYVRVAQQELLSEARKAIAEQRKDYNTYSFKSNPVAFNESNPQLSIGDKVRFVNNGYELITRVQSLTTNLDYTFEQQISVGNAIKKGNITQLKEEVASANANIDLATALSKQTQETIDAYRRTQEALNQAMAKYADMWDFYDEDTIISKYNVASEKAISAGGKDTTQSGGGSGDNGGSTGGSFDASSMWEELRKKATNSNQVIHESHLPDDLLRKSDLMWKTIRE